MESMTKTATSRSNRDRRAFVGKLAATAVSTLLLPNAADAFALGTTKAVAFDAFAIFDPRPVFSLADVLFPGRGVELSALWRTRQFEYTWLRNSMGVYADFWQVTLDALNYAAAQLHIQINSEQSARLMSSYLHLNPWPDVVPVLQALKARGIRRALLSNLTPRMLQSCVKGSSLDSLFDFQLSTDRVQAFKPSPRAYAMGMDAFGLSREEIVFVAFAGWDVAGAKHFGFPTYWANRLDSPAEELPEHADVASRDLQRLTEFIATRSESTPSRSAK